FYQSQSLLTPDGAPSRGGVGLLLSRGPGPPPLPKPPPLPELPPPGVGVGGRADTAVGAGEPPPPDELEMTVSLVGNCFGSANSNTLRSEGESTSILNAMADASCSSGLVLSWTNDLKFGAGWVGTGVGSVASFDRPER